MLAILFLWFFFPPHKGRNKRKWKKINVGEKENVHLRSERNWNRSDDIHDTSTAEVGGGEEKRRGWEQLLALFSLILQV